MQIIISVKGHCVWHYWGMKSFNKKDDSAKLGDEAPRLKDFIIVVVVVAILLLLSWVTYYKLGWFH